MYDISGRLHLYNKCSGRLLRVRLGGEPYKIEYAQSSEVDQITDENKIDAENLMSDLLNNRGYNLESMTAHSSQSSHSSQSASGADFPEGRLPCDSCDRRFRNKQALANHARTHVRERAPKRKFGCNLCKADFFSGYNLKRHLKDIHKVASATV